MASQDRESYKYLQVDRPILAGGDRFLFAVEEIGKRALGTVIRAAVTEQYLEGNESELHIHSAARPVTQARLDVYSPHDLKMILLRRVASNRMGSRYNFNHQAASLTTTRKATVHKSSKVGHRPGKSAQNLIDEVGTGEGIAADHTPITCDRIAEGYDSILGRFLALAPKSSPARFILGNQAKAAFQCLEELSPRVAHGANPTIPSVPFASLPEDIRPAEYGRLMDDLNTSEILPVKLVMGSVDIYVNSTVPRQSGLSLEE